MGELLGLGKRPTVPEDIARVRQDRYGSIRPMTTMEQWEMQAQEAYASRDPWKRLDVVPDIGPAAGVTKTTRSGVEGLLGLLEKTKIGRFSSPSAVPRSQNLRFHGTDLKTAEKLLSGEPLKKGMLSSVKDAESRRAGDVIVAFESDMRSPLAVVSAGDEKIGKPVAVILQDAAQRDADFLGRLRGKQPIPRGDRAGPMVQKAGSGEPYKSMPQSRQGEVSKTSVTPFELQQLGLSKGAEPWDMGSKTTLGPATRPKRGKK